MRLNECETPRVLFATHKFTLRQTTKMNDVIRHAMQEREESVVGNLAALVTLQNATTLYSLLLHVQKYLIIQWFLWIPIHLKYFQKILCADIHNLQQQQQLLSVFFLGLDFWVKKDNSYDFYVSKVRGASLFLCLQTRERGTFILIWEISIKMLCFFIVALFVWWWLVSIFY